MVRNALLFWLCTVMIAAASAQEPRLEVGAASATVNPEPGVYLAGYDLDRKSTGVHDDLSARAVAFYDGESVVVLLVVDAVSLQYDTVQAIRGAASRLVTRIPLPPERVIVQATHTHCAPDTIGIYGPDEMTCGRNAAYMERLVDTCARQVAQAVDNLRPAKIVFAETECKGWAVNDSEPHILDNAVTVLQALDADGKSIATLTHFACHPTVLDGHTTLSGADWVAAFYRTMDAMPGEHLYLQGAIGCWVQPVTPERTFALAEKYGADLGQKVLAALPSAQPLAPGKVRFAVKPFDLPNENPKFMLMGALGLVPREFGESIKTEVAWFAVGDAQFATLPGEAAPEYARMLKDLMDSGPRFTLGLGLDHLGYICPERYFDQTGEIPHAEYLIEMSPGRQAGPAMMAALQSIVP